ncbi:helix-turn-helix domain-containing protein [Burkholderia multivorans]|uniref:Helix-turn-helix domain-containing protein n=1 Tax=Burkholderia multivorans TaxID=87883 RepID=A0AAP2HM86_9BURK|nr:LexA family transcriptional regulator [Burkholderia multivorans]MBU9358884.1 helix-turn-helix domain-containing protein [Burkholderia multivorans]MBU9532839.1 helix-turn-helix domain-containing protein [Burkholderia multivorans]MBU9679732.1 helix-turn-helix domain-containing protein [Burkholderia multivorans]MCA7960947.1 helix-turn-helix domain-containing protein [Burkholderia multivorans]MCO1343432.1 helix-turn-helix domain-containing protein [Burkholderia multivorans]
MNTLAERLKACRIERALSQNELASLAGVSQSTVANIETGRNTGSKYLVLLANALEVDSEWLLTGKGEKRHWSVIHREHEAEANARREGDVLVWDREDDLPHDPRRVWIDRYDYRFSAGNGHTQWEIREKNALPFNEDFFKAIGSNPKHCKLVVCHGRSMEPFLYDRDMIMVDTEKLRLREEKIYALWLEDEPLVKQVFKSPGGGIVLHSFNPAYPDKVIEPEQMDRLKIFGQCVYRSGSGFL